MPNASILGDKAKCPADGHGCPSCPHPTVGPAVAGSPTVFVNGKPLLRLSDPGVHAACCGPNVWKITQGSATVYANGKPVARLGDATKHCGGVGKLIEGSSNVFVGGSPTNIAGFVGFLNQILQILVNAIENALKQHSDAAIKLLDEGLEAMERWNEADKEHFEEYFGKSDDETRQAMMERTRKAKSVLKTAKLVPSNGQCDDAYACVFPDDQTHTIYLGEEFTNAPSNGVDSKAGTLIHEVSHFEGVGDTQDHAYGIDQAKSLAKEDSDKAVENADNFEYYFETLPR